MARTRTLEMLDRLIASGRSSFTTAEVSEFLDLSRQAASNLLTRLVDQGLVDRVARGHYVIRPLGLLGTSAAAEETSLAVGALFAGKPHRIAYRSAFAHHGLLLHPTRDIQVAAPQQVRVVELSGRALRVVVERTDFVDVGAIAAGHAARVSDLERALLDGARRLDLIGGLDVLAEALRAPGRHFRVERVREYAKRLNDTAGLRRLSSVARVSGLDGVAEDLVDGLPRTKRLPADPLVSRPPAWTDPSAGVVWSSTDLDTVRST